MMLRIAILGLALCAAAPAAAQSRAVDVAKSRIAFIYTVDQKITVEGRFPKFAAQVAFDEKQPEKGSVKLEIDLGAIDTAAEGDTTKPALGSTCRSFRRHVRVHGREETGDGRSEAAGKLTIKGKSRDARHSFTPPRRRAAARGAGNGDQGPVRSRRGAVGRAPVAVKSSAPNLALVKQGNPPTSIQ